MALSRIIPAVESRPPLWDTSNRHFKNKDLKDKLWHTVHGVVWRAADSDQRNKLVADVQRNWKSVRDQYRREFMHRAHPGRHSKRPYKYGPLLGFLDSMFDLPISATNVPTPSAPVSNESSSSNDEAGQSQQPQEQASASGTQSIDESLEEAVEGETAGRGARNQSQSRSSVQNQTRTRSDSPCSRVDRALLALLESREKLDGVALYCRSLEDPFRKLPPGFEPRMSATIETLFQAALQPIPNEECFWLLDNWSLNGSGRYSGRASNNPMARPGSARPSSNVSNSPVPSVFFEPHYSPQGDVYSQEPTRPVEAVSGTTASARPPPTASSPLAPACADSGQQPARCVQPSHLPQTPRQVSGKLRTPSPMVPRRQLQRLSPITRQTQTKQLTASSVGQSQIFQRTQPLASATNAPVHRKLSTTNTRVQSASLATVNFQQPHQFGGYCPEIQDRITPGQGQQVFFGPNQNTQYGVDSNVQRSMGVTWLLQGGSRSVSTHLSIPQEQAPFRAGSTVPLPKFHQ